MKYNWEKLGLIFDPKGRAEWMKTHCQLPIADHIKGDIYRIYFATRNEIQVSQIGYVEIDIKNPKEIIKISEKPILRNGDLGYFDEHGVFPSSIVNFKGRKYLYYVGWVRGFESPMFYANIGLAISDDNGETFKKIKNTPIMSRSKYDPCLVTSPDVFIDSLDGIWKMSYVSGIKWFREDGLLKSKYHIKTATSLDGIKWIRNGNVAIDFKNEDETNIARPSVIQDGTNYKMWFSFVEKGQKYKIGYASSKDFFNWVREDKFSGIDLSKKGFDDQMTCYPNVFGHKNSLFMLYNGNNFGMKGFGIAKIKN